MTQTDGNVKTLPLTRFVRIGSDANKTKCIKINNYIKPKVTLFTVHVYDKMTTNIMNLPI